MTQPHDFVGCLEENRLGMRSEHGVIAGGQFKDHLAVLNLAAQLLSGEGEGIDGDGLIAVEQREFHAGRGTNGNSTRAEVPSGMVTR